MSTIPFYRDTVFWSVFILLNAFWFAGLRLAYKNGWATSEQMLAGNKFGINWTGHFGFWSLLFFVQPVLSWATARMWPLWLHRGSLIAFTLVFGFAIGLGLQTMWSSDAGSSDAWSEKGRPNNVGVLHIAHMVPEIAIILLLLISGLWYQEMPWPMFFGILLIVMNHFLLGITHWPLRAWFPLWAPQDWTQVQNDEKTAGFAAASVTLLVVGFALLLV